MNTNKEWIYALIIFIILIGLFMILKKEEINSTTDNSQTVKQSEAIEDIRWTQQDSEWIKKEWTDQDMGLPDESFDEDLLNFWF